MPSRFVVPVPDDNDSSAFLADVYTVEGLDPETGRIAFPEVWSLTFDACETGGLVFEYLWYVDGALVGREADCTFSHDFPEEGSYRVRLVAVGTDGELVESERLIEVLDHLIFGLGDSYGSGEGNPDLPITVDMLDAYDEALVALSQAQADANAAYSAWQSALAQWNDLVGRVNLALARLDIWAQKVRERQAACPWPPIPCADALAAEAVAAGDLVWALGNIGIADWNVNNLPSYSVIWNRIMAIYNAGLATYQLALSAWNLAQATLNDTIALVGQLDQELVAIWQDRGCHRSAFSGQVRAAKRIEDADPHSSVTFVHLACSGARIDEGAGRLIQKMENGVSPGMEMATATHLQVGEMRRLLDGGSADAVFLSIGGNDIGFADLIAMCVGTEPCDETSWVPDALAEAAIDSLCAANAWFLPEVDCVVETLTPGPGESARTHFDANLAALPARYQELARWFDGTLPEAPPGVDPLGPLVPAHRVFLTEYPDFTKDENSAYCGWSPGAGPDQMIGVSSSEHAFASSYMAAGLRETMMETAGPGGLGWRFVTNISDPFATHGYCAADPWIVRIVESFETQRDGNGTVHPTVDGHGAYAVAIETHFLPEPTLPVMMAPGLALLAWLRARGRQPCGEGPGPWS